MPVFADQFALNAQQVKRRLVLRVIQLIGVLDTQSRIFLHQIQRGIGNVDGAVEGLDASLVGFAIGKVLLFKDNAPGRRLLVAKHLGVVHQYVPAPLVWHPIMFVVLKVPRRLLKARIDILVARDQANIDRLHLLAAYQAGRGVAGGGHQVEAAFIHQRDHFIRGAGRLYADFAAAGLLEIADPVEVLVRGTALDIASPSHDVHPSFALADFLQGLLRQAYCAKGGDTQRDTGVLQEFHVERSIQVEAGQQAQR